MDESKTTKRSLDADLENKKIYNKEYEEASKQFVKVDFSNISRQSGETCSNYVSKEISEVYKAKLARQQTASKIKRDRIPGYKEVLSVSNEPKNAFKVEEKSIKSKKESST